MVQTDTKITELRILENDAFRAIELKFEHKPMEEIALEVGRAYSTVRNWFAKGGRLQIAYDLYADEESKLRQKRAHERYAAMLNKALDCIDILLDSGHDPTKLKAAQEVINRNLGEPLKRYRDETDDTVGRILRAAGITDQ